MLQVAALLTEIEPMIEQIYDTVSQQDINVAVTNMVPWKAAVPDALASAEAIETRMSRTVNTFMIKKEEVSTTRGQAVAMAIQNNRNQARLGLVLAAPAQSSSMARPML